MKHLIETVSTVAPLFKMKHAGNCKYNAQLNLDGLTHYVEDSTLKFHGSRILAADHVLEGLFFMVIDSAKTSFDGGRACSWALFDAFGNMVAQSKRIYNKNAAMSNFWEFMNSFDAVDHYKNAVFTKIHGLQNDLNDLNAAFNELNA